ncbi:hypothetical protein [Tessaracoccus coleopterorum]|nr:hypothetical protein [Tessaracoccus coleopterorum]
MSVNLVDREPAHVGWCLLVRASITSIELNEGVAALGHQSGRYF